MAKFYRSQHAVSGAEECRWRYRELTGETLLDPPLLPDDSELIPDKPEDMDLTPVLTGLVVRGLIDRADAAEMTPDMANGLARRVYKL